MSRPQRAGRWLTGSVPLLLFASGIFPGLALRHLRAKKLLVVQLSYEAVLNAIQIIVTRDATGIINSRQYGATGSRDVEGNKGIR